jgi:hypothetical protein
MGRHGYSDDLDQWDLIRWRGQVKSAIRGRRGQTFLRSLLAALDAMPEKRLVRKDLETDEGEVCTLGCALRAKGEDPKEFDPYDHDGLGATFDVAPCLVQEVEWENDENGDGTPEERWKYMRNWVAAQLKAAERKEDA